MDEYTESLERNETFNVTELQPDKTVIGGKWVYRVYKKTQSNFDAL